MFKLTKKQAEKLNEWSNQKDLTIYTGAIGGRFTYQFTPTSIGVVVRVIDNIDKTEIDLSEYDEW